MGEWYLRLSETNDAFVIMARQPRPSPSAAERRRYTANPVER